VVPNASNSFCNCSGSPDRWSMSEVDLGSVTQQSISEFAIVKVFAKLPKSSILAANLSAELNRDRYLVGFVARSLQDLCKILPFRVVRLPEFQDSLQYLEHKR
jgi:hypothetical protein